MSAMSDATTGTTGTTDTSGLTREAVGAAAQRLGEQAGELAGTAFELNEQVPTWAWTTAGLIGGYGLARATGVRALGGAVLLGAGAAAAHTWWHRGGPARTAALGAVYVLGFGLSHPLAKRIGAWPSVLAVTAVSGAAGWALVDRAGRGPERVGPAPDTELGPVPAAAPDAARVGTDPDSGAELAADPEPTGS